MTWDDTIHQTKESNYEFNRSDTEHAMSWAQSEAALPRQFLIIIMWLVTLGVKEILTIIILLLVELGVVNLVWSQTYTPPYYAVQMRA